MKLSKFITKDNSILVLSALTDFMNSKLLTVRCSANEILTKEFCKQVNLNYSLAISERSEFSVTFTDVQLVQKLKNDLKIDTNEAFTPILLNKYPHLVEVSLIIL